MAMGMVSFILDTMRSLLTHICRKDFPFSIRKLAGLEGEIVQRVLYIIRLVVGRFLDHNPLFRKYLRHRVVMDNSSGRRRSLRGKGNFLVLYEADSSPSKE